MLDFFAHGGCHVFAMELRKEFGYPLLLVREIGDSHNHVATIPESGMLLDVFGWFSFSDYAEAELLAVKTLRFGPTEEEAIRARFTTSRGQGYYVHGDFLLPATQRAREWIATHRHYFDGTKKAAIPDLCRIERSEGIW